MSTYASKGQGPEFWGSQAGMHGPWSQVGSAVPRIFPNKRATFPLRAPNGHPTVGGGRKRYQNAMAKPLRGIFTTGTGPRIVGEDKGTKMQRQDLSAYSCVIQMWANSGNQSNITSTGT